MHYQHVDSCQCTGKNGQRKRLYKTRREAEEQARFAKIDREVELQVYTCPRGKGFHLTSKAYCY